MNIQTKHIHLSFIALLVLLFLTIGFAFYGPESLKEYSTYGFALLKSAIILFIFMKVGQTHKISLIYMLLALVTLGLLILFILDDVLFRT